MRNDYILSYPEELLGEVAYGEELDGTITVYSNGGYVGNIVPHKPLPDILPKVRYFILNDKKYYLHKIKKTIHFKSSPYATRDEANTRSWRMVEEFGNNKVSSRVVEVSNIFGKKSYIILFEVICDIVDDELWKKVKKY